MRSKIVSGYAKISVCINEMLNIRYVTIAKSIVLNSESLYSQNSFDNITVMSLSEITINNIIKIIWLTFEFMKL